MVLTNFTGLHRDLKKWATPDALNQEHFLENGQFRKSKSFLPFSIGELYEQERVQSSYSALHPSSPCSPLLQLYPLFVALSVAPFPCKQGLLQITFVSLWLYFLQHGEETQPIPFLCKEIWMATFLEFSNDQSYIKEMISYILYKNRSVY